MIKIVRVLTAQTVTILEDDIEEKVVRLARIGASPYPFVTRLYIEDMIQRPYEASLTDKGLEVFVKIEDKLLNLSDQMVLIGFALAS